MTFTGLLKSDVMRDGGSYFVRTKDDRGEASDLFIRVIMDQDFRRTGYRHLVRRPHFNDKNDLEEYDWDTARVLFEQLDSLPRLEADFNESRFREMKALIESNGRPTSH